MKSKVVMVVCKDYDEENVYNAMKRGILELGGIEQFVKKEEKILVKPNFLLSAAPEKAVTTHPSVIRGLLRILSENEYKDVMYGDSPGHGSGVVIAKKLGLKEVEYGAKLADMSHEVKVFFEEGKTENEFYFCEEVTKMDALINVCKMKTHALEKVTGAVKNLYGLVCGYRKAAGHVAHPNASVFARMLCDIHKYTKPRLHIMDGIVAMEGNGPGNGTPTPMNVLLFSSDPVALDTLFCHLVYVNPETVPTNAQGEALGIGTYHAENIEITVIDGDRKRVDAPIDQVRKRYGNRQFHVDRKGRNKSFLSKFSAFMTALSHRPVIDKKKCIKCGVCVNHCPVPGKAVDFKNGKNQPPVYDYKKCIRCYCCQEMCPKGAIRSK